MKKELSGKVVEILTSMQNAIGKAGDFAIEQLPDVAHSYLIYGQISAVVWFSIWMLFLFLSTWCLWSAIKNPWMDTLDTTMRADSNITTILLAGMGGIFSLIMTMSTIPNMLLVFLAPKVWLLKELANLIR